MTKIDFRYFNLLIILITLVLPVDTLAKKRWHVPGAEFRLTVHADWKLKNTILVRLPVEFHGWKHATVLTPAGNRVGCRPVVLNGKMLAVEVSVSNTQMAGLSGIGLSIYPTETAAAGPDGLGQPVSCAYAGESFVARPADCGEMHHYLKTHKQMKFYRTLPGFPVKTYGLHLFYKFQSKKRTTSLNSRSLKVRACLSTNLFSAVPETIEFAVNNTDSGPWYMFMNNKPVFSWGNAVFNTGEVPRSLAVTTRPGLNRIDLFTLPDTGEMFPEIRIRKKGETDFATLAYRSLFSPNECLRYSIEHREKGVLCGFNLLREVGSDFRESQHSAFPYKVVDLTPGKTDGRAYTFNGKALDFSKGPAEIVLSESEQALIILLPKGAALRRLTIPIRPDFFAIKEQIIKLRLSELPMLEPIEDKLMVSYTVSVDHRKANVSADTDVLLSYCDATGKQLRETRIPVHVSPLKRIVELDRSIPELAYVELKLGVQSMPVSNTVKIYLVKPTDPPDFAANGGKFLHYRDGFAVLRRQAGVVSIPTPAKKEITHVALIDGFIANTDHPYDTIPPIKMLAGGVCVSHIPIARQVGDQSRLATTLCLLKTALEQKADAVIIAPPFDMIRTLDFRDQREFVLFVVKALHSAGTRAIFLSPPLEGSLARKKLRNFALMLKEIGRSFDMPVVDLYSASLRQGSVEKYWKQRLKKGIVLRSAVPNAEGHAWILSEINDLLEHPK